MGLGMRELGGGRSQPSAVAIAVAHTLARRRGIVGVYWGHARRGGVWTNERCLCVHVDRKHPRDDLPARLMIPRRIHGIATDVLEVGAPRVCAASSGPSAVEANDARRSTSSMVGKIAQTGEVVALGCGHGLMPRNQTSLASSFKRVEALSTVKVQFRHGESMLDGKLVFALLDEENDVSVVSFAAAGIGSELVSSAVDLMSAPLAADRAVTFVSLRSSGGVLVRGAVAKQALNKQILNGPFGLRIAYKTLLVVRPDSAAAPFAVEGDSGALVFSADEQPPRCVGMVIGMDDAQQAYVLPLAPIVKSLGTYQGAFFR